MAREESSQDDFGKHRTYFCVCGLVCFRGLREQPRPCTCGQPLEGFPFVVCDVVVSSRNLDYAGKDFG